MFSRKEFEETVGPISDDIYNWLCWIVEEAKVEHTAHPEKPFRECCRELANLCAERWGLPDRV